MKQKRTFLVTISVIFILFVGTLLYAILRDNDAYRYFTGLGEHISIAPDDGQVAFSYYLDGNESIYTANLDGTHVKQISSSNNRDSQPKYSPNGKELLFLSKDSEGMQTIRLINVDGSNDIQLTDQELHVTDAIYSDDGETVFFVAVEAEEFKKGEESREGFDLYSIEADGEQMQKLTDADHFSMNDLFLDPNGDTIYYSEFDGVKDRIYSYSLEDGKVNTKPSILSKKTINAQSFYHPQLSPDGRYLAFTEVSEESKDSSLFKYDLFLLDIETQDVERLTDLKTAVTAPTFFHTENKIAFLENTNWAADPAVHQLRTIDMTTHDIETIKLDTPQSEGGNWLMQMLDRTVNGLTIAILYILLLGILSVYLHYYRSRKAYLPSIVSFAIALLTFAASFVVARTVDPWYGVGLMMLAAGIFGCSIIVILFVFIYKRFVK